MRNGAFRANVIAYILLCLFILAYELYAHLAHSAEFNYCSEHYCANVPRDVIVVNHKNWPTYRHLLPEPIIEKFEAGSKRELWIFTQEKNLTVAVEYVNGRVRIDHPSSYCETIQKKLGEKLTDCGHVFQYRHLRGLQTISFKGKDALSFIRIFMPLNGGSVYFVCAGRWDSEYVVRKTYARVRKIVASMRIKR